MTEFRAVHDGERAGAFPVMSSAPRICRKCGAEILADAPEGLCTACLFEVGLGLLTRAFAAAGQDSAENVEPSEANAASHSKKAAAQAKAPTDFGDYELLEEI